MLRYLLRRVSLIPPALLLVHFLGFAYAHVVRPLCAFRNPFLAATSPPLLLLATYADLIRKALNFNFGSMPDPWGINREITIPTYVCTSNRECLALRPESDQPVWEIQLGEGYFEVNGRALVPGPIYISTEQGQLFVIE